MIIHLCPNCKEYLAICDRYKFCCYCGSTYDKNKLIIVDIDIDEPRGQPDLRSNIPGLLQGLSIGESWEDEIKDMINNVSIQENE